MAEDDKRCEYLVKSLKTLKPGNRIPSQCTVRTRIIITSFSSSSVHDIEMAYENMHLAL